MTGRRAVSLWVPIIVIVSLMYGCGIEVPPDKKDYVGEWQSREMYLLILQDGSVKYSRIKGGVTKTVSGPLRGFEGNNFVVGVSLIKTTFVVSEPPHLDGSQWKMTVDGVTLVKTGS